MRVIPRMMGHGIAAGKGCRWHRMAACQHASQSQCLHDASGAMPAGIASKTPPLTVLSAQATLEHRPHWSIMLVCLAELHAIALTELLACKIALLRILPE